MSSIIEWRYMQDSQSVWPMNVTHRERRLPQAMLFQRNWRWTQFFRSPVSNQQIQVGILTVENWLLGINILLFRSCTKHINHITLDPLANKMAWQSFLQLFLGKKSPKLCNLCHFCKLHSCSLKANMISDISFSLKEIIWHYSGGSLRLFLKVGFGNSDTQET